MSLVRNQESERARTPVVKVNARGTSRESSRCGETVARKLSKRIHRCPGFGRVLDRDENAAINVPSRGAVVPRTHDGAGCGERASGNLNRRKSHRNATKTTKKSEAMADSGDPKNDDGGHRERISTLTGAILRMSESLDLETVLREVVEGARTLTGARYGAITTVDTAGRPENFITSGVGDEEHRRLAEWPDGPRLFQHFRDLEGPLRIPDVLAYVRSLGFSEAFLPSSSFQGTPMRHRGSHVGNFYLAGKEGGEAFTDEDEEVLALFAAQAANAVANARTYRTEQRARADLEALVETSPVGVAVFDAATGGLLSLNREAKRMMGRLCEPGQTPDQLLEHLACRRADGSEIRLDELPLAEKLRNAETVRAEEIVLSVPDGRSVTTLLNATPIRTEDRTVVSMVVTMQDLAPLEELERQRTEFLQMVSHELRAPLISVKGAAATALGTDPRFEPAETREFFRIIEEQADRMQGLISDLLDAGRIDSGTLSVDPRPSHVADLVDQARRTFLSGGRVQNVQIEVPPDLPRVMVDARRIVQVLTNLLTNAARHSPVSSPIRVSAVLDELHVAVSVADEGRGIAPEALPHLLKRNFLAGQNGDRGLGGSGLGLLISRGLVEAHGGRIWVESPGIDLGSRFTFTVPVAVGLDGPVASGAPASRSRSPGNGPEPACILVVDDDPNTLRSVRDTLASAGYATVATGDPRELPRLLRAEKPRLVLLDLMLPGTGGMELMEHVPELAEGEVPVIFISAYGGDETVAKALTMGAADYVVKPFSPTELTARVRAVLRRRAEPERFVLGNLTIDYAGRQVTVRGGPVKLTPTEYGLLRVFSLNAGSVLTYDSLIRQVWDGQESAGVEVVRTFVKRLRNRLGDDIANPVYIHTERGVGYRMTRPGDSS